MPTLNKRNTKPYPDVDNSSSQQKIREVLTSVDANFSLDGYHCRVSMFCGDEKCFFDTVDLETDSTNSYTLIGGGQCDIEAVNTTGPISPFIQSLTDGDILSLSNAVLKTTTLPYTTPLQTLSSYLRLLKLHPLLRIQSKDHPHRNAWIVK